MFKKILFSFLGLPIAILLSSISIILFIGIVGPLNNVINKTNTLVLGEVAEIVGVIIYAVLLFLIWRNFDLKKIFVITISAIGVILGFLLIYYIGWGGIQLVYLFCSQLFTALKSDSVTSFFITFVGPVLATLFSLGIFIRIIDKIKMSVTSLNRSKIITWSVAVFNLLYSIIFHLITHR